MKTLHLVVFHLIILSTISQSPDQLYDELFRAVQIQRLFSDSKTFCDVVPRKLGPNQILDLYRQEYDNQTFNLTSFIFNNFIIPNTTTIVHEKWTIEQHCHRLWPLLTRTTNHENFSSFIDVPYQFVVPGGRFREFYYWDTYFTMLGLIRSKEIQLIDNMLENFAYLIRTVGHIPNGNRYYYEGRSQPPFFSLMTELTSKTDKYKDELEKEYQFWMNKRTAESGWDFSSRWMEDEKDLSTIITTNILPVDLNCLLYHLELTLNKKSQAENRRRAIHKYMWSDDLQFFTDYNFIQKKPTNRLTLAALYPVWLDIATKNQAQNVARQVESLFLRDGGVVTTISNQSTQQWDNPNGWAPLQYIAYRALLKTPGYESLGETIRRRWMALNEKVFQDTGKMMEKYDVVNINKSAGGGEYKTQDGFGWTNGVYLEMLYDQQPISNTVHYRKNIFQISSLIFFIFILQ
ncbi:unnamed protein product [Rotaria magnacalcarata]|uniref:Trehalase n=2 Tax=Rotaria magnacalcarata TaxID=392030 RepID=A0A816N327_9BILA|nr:unnamed protein product [Rotaria magnacalcarata]